MTENHLFEDENDAVDVVCRSCGWAGSLADLDDDACPDCGSKKVEPVEGSEDMEEEEDEG